MALCIQPTELNRLNMETIDKVESMKGYNSSTDDDDEDEEPQPPPNIRRKVSFADAFGLNLVSVKEFDNADTADSDTSLSCEWEEVISTEDFYMCCLFTVPATPEELERKVQMQMLELESIELLPKTTTLRGIVRVLNKVKENESPVQDESCDCKSKKSCLKVNRRESAEEQIKDTLNAATHDTECTRKTDMSDQTCRAKSSLHLEENTNTVESIKSRHRAVRSARALDPCPQRTYPHDSHQRQKGSQPISSAHCNSSGPLRQSNKAQTKNMQVHTYHQIPTLDWSGNDDVDKLWTERPKITMSESPVVDAAAVYNMWETFANGIEGTIEPSVFDAWQVFLNSPGFVTQSDVSASCQPMSPSNDENTLAQHEPSKQVHVGQDTPNLAAPSSSARHPLPDTAGTSPVALNSKTQEKPGADLAYVTGQFGDDNTDAHDAPQRSDTNSATETPQVFGVSGAKPVSKGSDDRPSECREHEIWEREGAGIMGEIVSIGQVDEKSAETKSTSYTLEEINVKEDESELAHGELLNVLLDIQVEEQSFYSEMGQKENLNHTTELPSGVSAC
uniref:Uncharacterized protein n=1 Tax=Knipowitschia caucasica TaxID=637954 RepID=A0AAV2IUG1_KNICA